MANRKIVDSCEGTRDGRVYVVPERFDSCWIPSSFEPQNSFFPGIPPIPPLYIPIPS